MSDFAFKQEDLVDTAAIAKAIKEKIQEQIVNSVSWQVQDSTKAAVLKTIEPEIQAMIEDQKASIVAGVKAALPEISKAIATAMIARVVINLESYNGRDIFKKLLD